MEGFIEPGKRIRTQDDLDYFRTTDTFRNLTSYIRELQSKVFNVPTDTPDEAITFGAVPRAIVAVLERLYAMAEETGTLPKEKLRFGDPSFRQWYAKLLENVKSLHNETIFAAVSDRGLAQFLVENDAQKEIGFYLLDSFGNAQRIDYGTGHELHFLAWLFCLRCLGVLGEEDGVAVVIRVLPAYLRLVRFIQTKFRLEPAGSHGVWSLDDHQFLPYIFGAAQLVDNDADLVPDSVLDPALVRRESRRSLYFDCIRHTASVKTGTFAENSPDLYNISASASWRKIASGMLKKYDADVLSKWPILQHFLFGRLISWQEPSPDAQAQFELSDLALGRIPPISLRTDFPESPLLHKQIELNI